MSLKLMALLVRCAGMGADRSSPATLRKLHQYVGNGRHGLTEPGFEDSFPDCLSRLGGAARGIRRPVLKKPTGVARDYKRKGSGYQRSMSRKVHINVMPG